MSFLQIGINCHFPFRSFNPLFLHSFLDQIDEFYLLTVKALLLLLLLPVMSAAAASILPVYSVVLSGRQDRVPNGFLLCDLPFLIIVRTSSL